MPAHSRSKNGAPSVAYVAGIHVLAAMQARQTWMAGTSLAMTEGKAQACEPSGSQLSALAPASARTRSSSLANSAAEPA